MLLARSPSDMHHCGTWKFNHSCKSQPVLSNYASLPLCRCKVLLHNSHQSFSQLQSFLVRCDHISKLYHVAMHTLLNPHIVAFMSLYCRENQVFIPNLKPSIFDQILVFLFFDLLTYSTCDIIRSKICTSLNPATLSSKIFLVEELNSSYDFTCLFCLFFSLNKGNFKEVLCSLCSDSVK